MRLKTTVLKMSEPPTKLIPRLSPGFLATSTVCGAVRLDDDVRLSADWRFEVGLEVLDADTGGCSREICDGDSGRELNAWSKALAAGTERLLIGDLVT